MRHKNIFENANLFPLFCVCIMRAVSDEERREKKTWEMFHLLRSITLTDTFLGWYNQYCAYEGETTSPRLRYMRRISL